VLNFFMRNHFRISIFPPVLRDVWSLRTSCEKKAQERSPALSKPVLPHMSHICQPFEGIISLTVHNAEEKVLNSLRNRPALAFTHSDLVHLGHRSDLGGCAGEKDFIGDVKRLAGNQMLLYPESQCAGDL